MIIEKISIGNKEEGFVEDRFTEGINVIFSDDNNKGKTIVIQGILFAIGNEPSFPATFNYEDYYFILEFFVNDEKYIICRKKTEFIINKNGRIFFFDNVSELKRYWTKNIDTIPSIEKNELKRVVDPELYVQIFFVGQDNKDTSNIANRGFYNKRDFLNLVYSFAGVEESVIDEDEIDVVKEKISVLTEEKKTLLKEHKILKSKRKSVSYLSAISDRVEFENKLKHIENNKNKITELKKRRNSCATRRSQWETTIKELNSLNRTIKSGELRCMDCDSTNIMYRGATKDSFSFDVSNSSMRSQIIESIAEKIDAYAEEIEKINAEISVQQEFLKKLLSDEEISIETIAAYKSQVIGAESAERRIVEIEEELSRLKSYLRTSEKEVGEKKEERKKLLDNIYSHMNNFYREVDPESRLEISELFTKQGEVFSGSEATMFFLSKMYALALVLKHNYPIIIDSFRTEDLSTNKEKNALECYKVIKNQIIFTTTLKKEEEGKYERENSINGIDYSLHTPNRILDKKYAEEIGNTLKTYFMI